MVGAYVFKTWKDEEKGRDRVRGSLNTRLFFEGAEARLNWDSSNFDIFLEVSDDLHEHHIPLPIGDMTIIQRSLRQAARYPIHQSLQSASCPGRAGLTGLSIIRRSFNSSARRWAEHSDVQVQEIVEKPFQEIWKEFKASCIALRKPRSQQNCS